MALTPRVLGQFVPDREAEVQTAGIDARLTDGEIAALPLRRRGASRTRILAATRQLLSHRSYDVLTMDAVADAARLTRRTIYHQFVGRQSLYRASREALVRSVAAQLPSEIALSGADHQVLMHFASQTLAALSAPDGTELLLSLLRDTEEHGWLSALYDRQCRAITAAAISRWLARTGRADQHVAAIQLAGLLEAMALAPCLTNLSNRQLIDSHLSLEPIVDSVLAMINRNHR